tara:strand:+ start:465 stop:1391 length:927 start_codon:yes stop_codon:yes gene_type:complete
MKIFNRNINFKLTKNIVILILLIILGTFSKIFITNSLYLKKIENQKQIDLQESKKIENMDYEINKIIYVNPENAFEEIKNSGYINKFSQKDMEVRKCDNKKLCEKLYQNNLIHFSYDDKRDLQKLIKLCNEKLIKHKNLYNVPWKLCKTTRKLEEGMPHTHTDIIFLSDSFFRSNEKSKIITLIHEKLHIYQRIKKEKTTKLYNNFNFSKTPKKNINLRRTNPDLDSFDYNYNGVLIYSEFQDDAKSLSDVDTKLISIEKNKNKEIREIQNLAKKGYQNEHPNEIFASIISEQIVNDNIDKIFVNYIN